MFDVSQDLTIKVKTPTGPKEVVISFPTTEQWVSRSAKIKMTSRALGRGKSETDVSKPERTNSELYDSVFVKGDELDEFEKSTVIERLSRSQVEDSCSTGNGYEVTLKVPGGLVKHFLRMPSAKQINQYRKTAVRIVDGRRLQEITIHIGAAETLYNLLIEKTEGYAGEVPIIHQSAVINEVLTLHDDDGSEGDIENF
jgi:hypothetical protein